MTSVQVACIVEWVEVVGRTHCGEGADVKCREMRDQIVIPMFEERIVEEQGVLETPEAWGKVLAFFSDAGMLLLAG